MYQSITVIGRLGRDPEMRYMPNGDPVTSFSVATDRVYNDKAGGKQKETTWFRVSVFGKQAETCNQYLSKGKMVLVEGRMGVDPATGGPKLFTSKDGKTGTSFEIVANTVRFLSAGEQGDESARPSAAPGGSKPAVRSEDFPF